ncbi:hypothetical protein [Serratia ureilytica]|nr:hypothetical protein [Serratia ureilytica]
MVSLVTSGQKKCRCCRLFQVTSSTVVRLLVRYSMGNV